MDAQLVGTLRLSPFRPKAAAIPAAAPSAAAPVPADSVQVGPTPYVPVRKVEVAEAGSLYKAAAPALPPLLSNPAALTALTELQAHGFNLAYRRQFWVPIIRPQYKSLSPQQFLDSLNQGCERLTVGSARFRPAPVRTTYDVALLHAYYVAGVVGGPPSLATAMRALYVHGYALKNHGTNLGPFGAYRRLMYGDDGDVMPWRGPIVAKKYGKESIVIRSQEDAKRVEFFRLGAPANCLPHETEANTLKALEARGATFWNSPVDAHQTNAEHAYQNLFQAQTHSTVWAGIKEAPLLPIQRHRLGDTATSVAAFDAARGQFERLVNLGVKRNQAAPLWERVRHAVASESYEERLQWMKALLDTSSTPSAAVRAYDFLNYTLRPTDRFDGALHDYTDIRRALGENRGHNTAADIFLRLRDRMDEALPGAEPAREKRQLYLQLLGALRSGQRVESVWRELRSAEPKADQVGVFLSLMATEESSQEACVDLRLLESLRTKGETLADVENAFKKVRAPLGRHGGREARDALYFVRKELPTSLPGPWTDEQREKMFMKMLTEVGNTSSAVHNWRFLAGKNPAPDFPQRLESFLQLLTTENKYSEHARSDYALVEKHLAAGETMPQGVAEFLQVRQRLGKMGHEEAQTAFRFLRGDIDKSLQGPWSQAEKRTMYLKMLGGLGSHRASLKYWQALAGPGAAPPDFPQRVDAFLAVCAAEHMQLGEAWKTFETVASLQRKGETLADTVTAFGEVREKLYEFDSKGGRDAFAYVRQQLPTTLPGAWTDSDRERMYLRVLGATRGQEQAEGAWNRLSQNAAADFPQVLDAFIALRQTEAGSEGTFRALRAVRQAVAAVQPPARYELTDGVAEYQALRAEIPHGTAEDGVRLYEFVRYELEAPERPSFQKLLHTLGHVPSVQAAWRFAHRGDPAQLADRVDLLVDCSVKSHSLEIGMLETATVLDHLRPGETVVQGGAALDQVRGCIRWYYYPNDVASAFKFVRRNVDPKFEDLYLQMLSKSGRRPFAEPAYDRLEKAGNDATMPQRMQILLRYPEEAWGWVVGRFEKIEKQIPADVDRDRARVALIRTVKVADKRAASSVLHQLSPRSADRTAELEQLCNWMELAGCVEGFDQAWQDISRPGAPGSMAERRALFGDLVEAGRGSAESFDASLDMMRRLDRVDRPGFPNAAAQSVALMGAMRGHARDAQRAMEYILDARDQGKYQHEGLDQTVARFATAYAGCGSLETALSRLDQAPGGSGGGGKIEEKDGDVIIGGVRVPRPKKRSYDDPNVLERVRDAFKKKVWPF